MHKVHYVAAVGVCLIVDGVYILYWKAYAKGFSALNKNKY